MNMNFECFQSYINRLNEEKYYSQYYDDPINQGVKSENQPSEDLFGFMDGENKPTIIEELKGSFKGFEIQRNKISNTPNGDLTEFELFVVYLLQNSERIIQEAAWNEKRRCPITNILIKQLDNALSKLPRTKETVIYRNTNDETIVFPEGDYTATGYLTCSKDNFENKPIRLIITPLNSSQTKARELYQVYDHVLANTPEGEEQNIIPEYQIEFERGTMFSIVSIETDENTKTFFMNELSDEEHRLSE